MDNPTKARVFTTRALHLNQQLGNGAGIAVSLTGMAHVLLATGELAAAAEHYRQAAADLASLEFPRAEAEARSGLGRALTAIGDHGQAREQLELAVALYEKIDSPQVAEALKALQSLPPRVDHGVLARHAGQHAQRSP